MDCEFYREPADVTAQPYYETLKALYRSLPEAPLKAETLANALAPYVHDCTHEELVSDCEALRFGILEGRENCRKFFADEDQQLSDEQRAAQLHEILQQCPPEERKARLLTAIDQLCEGCGYTLRPNMYGTFAASTEEQLEKDVAFLVRSSGDAVFSRMLASMQKYADGEHPELMVYADRFTAEEHMWICAAVAYAEGRKSDTAPDVTSLEEIGEEVGWVCEVLETVLKACADYVAPAVVGVGGIALSLLLMRHIVDLMLWAEEAVAGIALFGEGIVLPTLISSLPVVAAFLASFALFGVGFLGLSALAINVYNRIQGYMDVRTDSHPVINADAESEAESDEEESVIPPHLQDRVCEHGPSWVQT